MDIKEYVSRLRVCRTKALLNPVVSAEHGSVKPQRKSQPRFSSYENRICELEINAGPHKSRHSLQVRCLQILKGRNKEPIHYGHKQEGWQELEDDCFFDLMWLDCYESLIRLKEAGGGMLLAQ